MPSIVQEYGSEKLLDIGVTTSGNFISSRLPQSEKSRMTIDNNGNIKLKFNMAFLYLLLCLIIIMYRI